MLNTGSDESQPGIKISRSINNLRYADDTTLRAESEEELNKQLLERVKEESEKAGLKFNIHKTKIMASGLITSWQMEGKKVETMANFIFLGPKITADSDCGSEIKKMLAPWKESYDETRQHIKNRRPHLANKGPYIKSYGFSGSHLQM